MEHVLGNADYVKLILQHLHRYRDLHVAGRVCRLFRAIMEEKHVYRFCWTIQKHMYFNNKFPLKDGSTGYYIRRQYSEQMIDIIAASMPRQAVQYSHIVPWAINNGNMKYLKMCTDINPLCLLGMSIPASPTRHLIYRHVIDILEKITNDRSHEDAARITLRKIVVCNGFRELMEYIAGKDLVPKHVENMIKTSPHIGMMPVREFVEGLVPGEFDLNEMIEAAYDARNYQLLMWLIKLDKVGDEIFHDGLQPTW